MDVAMLAIGDELLDGRVVDTNSQRLARALDGIGLHLGRVLHLPDVMEVLVEAARQLAAGGCQLCVVSGGLGPTSDDVTAAAMAAAAGVQLVRDEAQADKIALHAQRRGRPLTANQLRQADRPAGAELVDNPVGTACGFALSLQGCRFVCLPGVPHEFDRLLEDALIAPRRAGRAPVLRRQLSVFGMAEAQLDHQLAHLPERWPAVRLQYRTDFPFNHLSMHAAASAQAQLEAAFGAACACLQRHVFSCDGRSLPQVVADSLRAHNLRLAVAESLTGGLVADQLTDVSGISAQLVASIVAYQPSAKVALLGVDGPLLAAGGAVSEACARQMAQGALQRTDAQLALSLTGLAEGDEGAAGRVWLALAARDRPTACLQLPLPHNRRRNKQLAAASALMWLWQQVDGRPPT